MGQPTLFELARQGNLEAIALLINRSLQPHSITAKLIRHESCLKILLEGAEVPPQSIAKSLQKGIEKLEISTIDRLEIHGKQSDTHTLTWTKTVQLAPPKPSSKLPSIQIDSAEAGTTKSRPRPYFALALLTTFLAFLPLGIAALIFSRRVKLQYQKQDYEGAKSASETAKILCIVGICLASPFYLAIGFVAGSYSILLTAYENQIDTLSQSQAKTAIEAINRSQQAYWLENHKFADSVNQLQLPSQSNNHYQYQLIPTEPDRAIITATATKPGLQNFIGIVYTRQAKPVAQSSDFLKTASLHATICTTDLPITPAQIRIEDDKVICPSEN